jgi:hypothetical protein
MRVITTYISWSLFLLFHTDSMSTLPNQRSGQGFGYVVGDENGDRLWGKNAVVDEKLGAN